MMMATYGKNWTENKTQLARQATQHSLPVVITWTLFVHLVSTQLLPRIDPPAVSQYVLQPVLWVSVAALVLYFWRRESVTPLPRDRWLIGAAAVVGLFQVAVMFACGVISGFGYSPYANSPGWMLANLWYAGTMLVAFEFARWYIFVRLGRKNIVLAITVAWALVTFVSLPVGQLALMHDGRAAVGFLGTTFLPEAAENVLATYLVMVGGPFVSTAYLGIVQAFHWLSPILPSFGMAFGAFVGVVVPIIGILAVHDLVDWRTSPRTKATRSERSSLWGSAWILVGLIGVFIFWFNSGLFGFRPSLISGQSMLPAMQVGDVAITRSVSTTEIKEGDIVRYKGKSGIWILHRVIQVKNDGPGLSFVTQGDNNDMADGTVAASQVDGRLVTVIPKIGWVPIWFRQLVDAIF